MACVDLDMMARDSYGYTRAALWDTPGRWLLLIVLGIIPIVNFIVYGYLMRVLRGDPVPPEVDNLGDLFVEGLRFVVASLLYWVIFGIIFGIVVVGGVIFAAGFGMAFEGQSPDNLLSILTAFIGIGIFYLLMIVAIVAIYAIMLIYFMAMVRVARSGRIGAAFDFSETISHIRDIGWFNYLGALSVISLILTIILYLIVGVGFLTFFVGFLLLLPLFPAIGIFFARFLSLVHDSAAGPA